MGAAAAQSTPASTPQNKKLTLGFGLLTQADIQLAQLFGIYHSRGLGHDAGGTLGFREGNHFANRAGTSHQHDQAVQAESQTAMGRRTKAQGIEQEAKLFFLLGLVNAQHIKYGLLHGAVMDTD